MNNQPAKLFPLQPSGDITEAHYTRTPEEAGIRYDELRAAYKHLPSSVFEGEQLKPVYKCITLDLSAAGVNYQVPIYGNLFKFKNSTNATDLLNVRFGTVQNDAIPFLRGQGFDGMFFDSLYLTWDAVPGASAVIVVMFDPREHRASMP